MKVISLRLSRFGLEMWFGYCKEFKDLVILFGAENLCFAFMCDCLLDLYGRAEKAMHVLRKSVYTQEVKEADVMRRSIFRGFRNVVKGMCRDANEDRRRAAVHLFNLIKACSPSILKGSYAEASGAIYKLLDELHGDYAADVARLAIGEWVDGLDDADNVFRTREEERFRETSGKPRETIKQIRPQLTTLIHAAESALNAKLMSDGLGGKILIFPPTPDSAPPENERDDNPHPTGNKNYDFVVHLNKTAKYYRDLMSKRQGWLAKRKEKEAPSKAAPQE